MRDADRMPSRLILRRGILTSCIIAALLIGSSFLASANTRVWTTQADFLSGTLSNADPISAPGDLELAVNASRFAKFNNNPVFTPSSPGSWDADSINGVAVLYDGDQFKMWYAGCTGVAPYFTCSLGYATSPNGLAWTRYSGNPVLNATAGQGTAELPTVIYDGGIYKMWFESYGTPGLAINYATSPDGVSWTQYPGNPVWSGGAPWDSMSVANPIVIRDGSQLVLYFSARGTNYDYEIGRALSPDGINWTEDPSNPLLVGSDAWELGLGVFPEGVHRSISGFTLYYGAGYSPAGALGRAFSPDGSSWTRDPSNPVVRPSATGWDSATLGAAKFVPVGGQVYAWYAGKGPNSNGWSYGLATTPAYSASGFFLSPVVDSGGAGTTWTDLNWSATASASSQVSVWVRAGDSAIPDPSWTAWYVATSNVSLTGMPRTRYAQVKAFLTTEDGASTPILHDVKLSYMLDRTSAPTPGSIGIGGWTNTSDPWLNWRFGDPDPFDSQAGYEVQIASTAGFAQVTYDSGFVADTTNATAVNATLQDGTWYWRVRTQDNWGAWSDYGAVATFAVDTTAPSTSLGYGVPSIVVSGSPYLTSATLLWLNATDGPAGVGVSRILFGLDAAASMPFVAPFRLNGVDGVHTILFRVDDRLGNDVVGQFHIVIDNTPPLVQLNAVPKGAGYAVTMTSSDEGSGVASRLVSIDGGDWTPYSGALTIEEAGTHTIRGYAVDVLGNRAPTATVQFAIPNAKPYVAGPIGALLLAVAVLLLRSGPWRQRWVLEIAAALGIIELSIAALSAGTGALAIPPWAGLSLALDGFLGAVGCTLFGFHRFLRAKPEPGGAAAGPPAAPPP